MAYQIEITDTFGGEANYSWVRRHTFDKPATASLRSIVRRAKALAGWTNVPCIVDDYGDLISIKPRGVCMVAHVYWFEGEEQEGA